MKLNKIYKVPNLGKCYPDQIKDLVQSSIILDFEDRLFDTRAFRLSDLLLQEIKKEFPFEGEIEAVIDTSTHDIATNSSLLRCELFCTATSGDCKISLWRRKYLIKVYNFWRLNRRQIHVFFDKSLEDQALLFKLSF